MAKFYAKLVGNGKLEIESKVGQADAGRTAKSLLQELSREYSNLISFHANNDEVDSDEYRVMLNDTDWESFPQRLETKLNEGDRVVIIMWLEPLTGG